MNRLPDPDTGDRPLLIPTMAGIGSLVLLAILWLLSCRDAGAAEVRVAWDAPTDRVTVNYLVAYRSGTDWEPLAVTPETSAVLDLADGRWWVLSVCGIGADGISGEWARPLRLWVGQVVGSVFTMR